MLEELERELKSKIRPEKAEFLPRFFKTFKGGYAEGDVMLGIVVPDTRAVARKYASLPEADVLKLLRSKYHEFRFCALCLLTMRYRKDPARVLEIYLENTRYVNNWDLVDLSAPKIVGVWCRERGDDAVILRLSDSRDLWEKRMSIVAGLEYYQHGELGSGLTVIGKLLEDEHDLIQKANGWMLREIYKRVDEGLAEEFIRENYGRMPRTTLRYAIERMPEGRRLGFLRGEF